MAQQSKFLNKHLKLTYIFSEASTLESILPHYLSRWVSLKLTHKGVNLLPNTVVNRLTEEEHSGKLRLTLNNNQEIVADRVIVSPDIDPIINPLIQVISEYNRTQNDGFKSSQSAIMPNVFLVSPFCI